MRWVSVVILGVMGEKGKRRERCVWIYCGLMD